MTSLSVLVPVYNEQHLIAESLGRLGAALERSPHLERAEVIVVDDGSTDGTAEALHNFVAGLGLAPLTETAPAAGVLAVAHGRAGKTEWRFLRHARNSGKGQAVRTALNRATCALTIIHDADLEYNPRDIDRILSVFIDEKADAVFGSRFAGSERRRALHFRHEMGNRLLNLVTNCVTDLNLTDMETCYKAVRTDLLRSIPLVSNDFRLEPEITIKLAKRDARIFEVPISYAGRTYQEGKKIGWRDGVRAMTAILRFAVGNDLFPAEEQGAHTLNRLAGAHRYNAWMGDLVRPLCGQRVLELGSGSGILTRQLVPRTLYYATDINPLYLESLRALQTDHPYLHVAMTDVTRGETFPVVPGGFDTVVCLNVIEHVDDERAALGNIHRALADGGRAIVLVPNGPSLMGTLDEVLGHRRRYTPESLQALAEATGFELSAIVHFNRAGVPAWWLNGTVLRRRRFGVAQILALNAMTPVFRRVDGHLPLPALSLIGVFEKRRGS